MNKYMQCLRFLALGSGAVFACEVASAQSITGRWVVVGYETGREKGVVEIYKKGEHYVGKVTSVSGPYTDPVCEACDGEKKGQKIIGMEVIWGLSEEDGRFTDGTILDVESGSEYRCELWVEQGNLMVRGFYLCFHNTQKWVRANETPKRSTSASGVMHRPQVISPMPVQYHSMRRSSL